MFFLKEKLDSLNKIVKIRHSKWKQTATNSNFFYYSSTNIVIKYPTRNVLFRLKNVKNFI
jgi:hypothetical protein